MLTKIQDLRSSPSVPPYPVPSHCIPSTKAHHTARPLNDMTSHHTTSHANLNERDLSPPVRIPVEEQLQAQELRDGG